MKKLIIIAAFVTLLVACTPPRMSQPDAGFPNAKAPSYGQITVGPSPIGDHALALWNWIAGRELFVRSDVDPQVTFHPSPYPETYSNGIRIPAFMTVAPNPDGVTFRHCFIYYDLAVPNWPFDNLVAGHELGHCLGFGHTDYPYMGVMSTYSNRKAFQGDDMMGLINAGYRAA